MANEAENAIYQRLAAAPTHHPSSATLFVNDWGLEPGDVVSVVSGEDSYSVPVYSMDLTWKGSSTVDVQSTGNQQREPLPALKRRQYGAGSAAYAGLQEQADRISLMVTGEGPDAQMLMASIELAISSEESSIHISADKIYLNGAATVSDLLTGVATATQLRAQNVTTGTLNAGSTSIGQVTLNPNSWLDAMTNGCYIYVDEGQLRVGTTFTASWKTKRVVTAVTLSAERDFMYDSGGGTQLVRGKIITAGTEETIYYLGHG